ncbi:MAG TPA: hypothetical protein VIV12_20460 [Streptosporangiaceae bacterium]
MYHSLTGTELRHLRYTLEMGLWDVLGYTEPRRVPSRGDVTVARELNAAIGEVEQEIASRRNCHLSLWASAYEYASKLGERSSRACKQFADAYALDYAGRASVPTPDEYNLMSLLEAA